MALIEFLREGLDQLYRQYDEAVADLSPEQWHWRPGEGCNHIAFSVWHYVRTVDNVIRFVLQRQPTLWMEGGWDRRFGLDSKSQGTGMSPQEAAALRLSPPEEFRRYMQEVWRMAREYTASLTDQDLERTARIRMRGELAERPLRTILGETLLTHGFSHLGEVWVLRGLQGLRGTPF